MDTYGCIWEALRLLGVSGDVDVNIDDLLVKFVFERRKQRVRISFEYDRERSVAEAQCSTWGLDELKAVEDKLLRWGKAYFKTKFQA
jgi:hypothetical protein